MFGRRVRAIRGGILIDGTGRAAVQNGLVVLDAEGRIVYSGPVGDPAAPELGGLSREEVLEAEGGTVLPGLIDSHVHLTFGTPAAASAGPGPAAALVPLVAEIRRDDDARRALRAASAARAALGAGVTTLRDCGAAGRGTHALRDLVARGVIAGPRILVSGTPITTRAGHCWWLGGEADSRDEVVALGRALIRDGADFVKVMATGGGMTPGSNRVQAQYPTETLAALVDDARRLGRRVAAHAHGVEGIDRTVAAGVHMVEHCSWETRDGLRLDSGVAERMAAAGTIAGDTITGQTTRYAKERAPLEALPAPLADRFRIFRQMRSMGVPVVTSSDAMYPVTPFEDFPWAIVASHDYGALTPEAAVHAATGLAAAALELDAEIGTLEAGKRGDVLVVPGVVTADIRALTEARAVLRDGIVVAGGGAVWEQGVY